MRIHGTFLGYVEILGYVPGRPCSAAAVAVRPRPVQKRPNRPSFRPWARVRTPSRKRTVPEWGGQMAHFAGTHQKYSYSGPKLKRPGTGLVGPLDHGQGRFKRAQDGRDTPLASPETPSQGAKPRII